jgi:hypothetical protein
MATHDPFQSAVEIREQLASEKRKLAFLLGAGTSMSVGIPGITALTAQSEAKLPELNRNAYQVIAAQLAAEFTVENVLDRLRIVSELLNDNEEQLYEGLSCSTVNELDSAICHSICELVGQRPEGILPHQTFAQWLHALYGTRAFPVEIFTTNYDLILEEAMEEVGLPFFDGFVGSLAPFFLPEAIEAEPGSSSQLCPPRAWTRLRKLHGSINWYIHKTAEGSRISRLHKKEPGPDEELVIFPSRSKYSQSRKLPFLAFQDRLRRLISASECLLIVIGYSWMDEHINEIVFQGLRSNSRLAVMTLIYGDGPEEARLARGTPEIVLGYGTQFRNLSVYGPDKACIGGLVGVWEETEVSRMGFEASSFWDNERNQFKLGDFGAFCKYIEAFVGFQSASATPQELSAEAEPPQAISTS